MSASGVRVIKGIVGAIVLLVLAVMVGNWWSDFRAASSTGASESTQTAPVSEDATPPDSGAEEGSDAEAPPADDATPVSGTIEVLIDGLNFRTSPQADAKPVRGLRKGEKLTVVSRRSGWYEARDKDGKKGWVSSNPNYTELTR